MEDDPEAFKISLGLSGGIPSAEIVRQRMDTMASSLGEQLRDEILNANVSLLKSCTIEPTALPNGCVPLDMDVTPFDNSKTKKEGVSRTYKGFDGYAPMMAYIGTEGYLVNNELRGGNQHCQKHTPQFIRETLKLSHQLTESPLLVLLDSGNDAAENLGILIEDGSYFIIKRNLRRGETKDGWLDKVKDGTKRRRLRTVINNLVLIAGHITKHRVIKAGSPAFNVALPKSAFLPRFNKISLVIKKYPP